MEKTEQTATIDAFTKGFIECALWSTDAGNEAGESLENLGYTIDDFSATALTKACEDCRKFQELAKGYIVEENFSRRDGYGFLLTRNEHGSRFWDGNYDVKAGVVLTHISRSFGEFNIYVGDDGQIYV